MVIKVCIFSAGCCRTQSSTHSLTLHICSKISLGHYIHIEYITNFEWPSDQRKGYWVLP